MPSDENGQRACQAAIAAKKGPESMLAYTAFWSSTNMKTETGMAPANSALPPKGIASALLQLAMAEGGDMDYDERYRRSSPWTLNARTAPAHGRREERDKWGFVGMFEV